MGNLKPEGFVLTKKSPQSLTKRQALGARSILERNAWKDVQKTNFSKLEALLLTSIFEQEEGTGRIKEYERCKKLSARDTPLTLVL